MMNSARDVAMNGCNDFVCRLADLLNRSLLWESFFEKFLLKDDRPEDPSTDEYFFRDQSIRCSGTVIVL